MVREFNSIQLTNYSINYVAAHYPRQPLALTAVQFLSEPD